ncbi:MAG: hypothetical protein HOH21_08795 [Acidimicrobiaceae bacterium]|jgi:hypothetical protein|nr:hypothetical protein [Acidimicrobiaceae bacterium]MBT5206813.1 hypothetical protein [Acidimicrobiaceae bacterium]MBT5568442.1 hypothetical protein [Acidimicrobiaceae bacterium]MBT6092911.1 hypothetical protein [Acidimicrobiaceae bacterium]
MSTQMYETRMFDEDGQRRVRSVVFATAGSAIGITLFLTVTTYLISPEHGWVAALGLGAMSGIWVSILGGAVLGNGIHEARAEAAGHDA